MSFGGTKECYLLIKNSERNNSCMSESEQLFSFRKGLSKEPTLIRNDAYLC